MSSSTDLGGGYGEAQPSDASGGSPKEMARDAAQTVKQEAASFAADAKEKAAEKLDQQKETASRTLGDFANAVRKAGDELAGSDQTMATHLVRRTADGLENFARAVADKRPEELIDAVRDFGRRHPTVFVAGSVLAGVAIGRLLRSSSAHDEARMSRAGTAGFTAPGGAPPTYPLGEMETAGPTMFGAEEAVVVTDVMNEPEGPQSGAAGGPSSEEIQEADRLGPRS